MDDLFAVFQAKAFYNAFINLERMNQATENGIELLVPVIVNGALSIELSLKAILRKNKIAYKKEHNLYILFSLLPDIYQNEILEWLQEKSPEYCDPKQFHDDFVLCSNAFAQWRYAFEYGAPALNPRLISVMANATIGCMFKHYNDFLTPTENIDKSPMEVDKMFEINRQKYIAANEEYIQKHS